MSKIVDFVFEERINKGLCPICKKPLGTDFKVVPGPNSKFKTVWIHSKHPYPEE